MGAQVEVVAVQESYTGAFPKRRLLHNVMRATQSPCFSLKVAFQPHGNRNTSMRIDRLDG